MWWLSWNLGASTSWSSLDLSRAVIKLLYLYICINILIPFHFHIPFLIQFNTAIQSSERFRPKPKSHSIIKSNSKSSEQPASIPFDIKIQSNVSQNETCVKYWMVFQKYYSVCFSWTSAFPSMSVYPHKIWRSHNIILFCNRCTVQVIPSRCLIAFYPIFTRRAINFEIPRNVPVCCIAEQYDMKVKNYKKLYIYVKT